jgi:hypothetical protein
VIPVFVVARDRPTYLRRTLAAMTHLLDAQVFIVDHGTTDPAGIQWLRDDCPFTVMWRGDKYVHDLWSSENFRAIAGNQPFAVTDPDVDLSDCPDDLIQTCLLALEAFPHVVKAGPALRLDDLPDTVLASRVTEWESQFWDRRLADDVYEAPIDTTFAVYRPLTKVPEFQLGPSARLGGKYTARHMPWYETEITDELRHYREHMLTGASHWPPENLT